MFLSPPVKNAANNCLLEIVSYRKMFGMENLDVFWVLSNISDETIFAKIVKATMSRGLYFAVYLLYF